MKTPVHVITFRAITVTITVLILLAVGFGLVGHGPLGSLGTPTSQADQWVHNLYATGLFG